MTEATILTMNLEDGSKKFMFQDTEEMDNCIRSGWIDHCYDYQPIDIVCNEKDSSCIVNVDQVALGKLIENGVMF